MPEIDFDQQLNGDMELNCALHCYFCVKYTTWCRFLQNILHCLFYFYEIEAFFSVFSQVSVIECVAFNTLDATRHLSGMHMYSPHMPSATYSQVCGSAACHA